VDCDETLQLERLQRRDGSSSQAAKAILAAQASRAARLKVADDVIRNDAAISAVRDQVAALHARYLELAARPRTQ
jgi:dephospho-CoA kinase